MACTPAEVMELAKCSACVPDADAALIYAMCAWANGGADPEEQGFLLNSEGGFILLSDGDQIIVQN